MTQLARHTTTAVKAALATDTGAFTAIAAAYSVDRVGERIVPGAFRASIEAHRASGKMIPLHWDHMGDPKNIIGTVDPAKMEETEDGLRVEGTVDLEESDIGREAWRLMKSGAMSLSFGYLVRESRKGEDGVTELMDVDVFEISVTPAPANSDTKFLELKSVAAMTRGEITAELKQMLTRAKELEAALETAPPEAPPDEDVQTPPEEDEGADGEEPADGNGDGPTHKASDPDAVKFHLAWLEAIANDPRSN